ncbi:hypothetical protein HK102_001877, partial [Quaeritorhiza haematococci]
MVQRKGSCLSLAVDFRVYLLMPSWGPCTFRTIGRNVSALNGRPMPINQGIEIHNGDTVTLLPNDLPIVFRIDNEQLAPSNKQVDTPASGRLSSASKSRRSSSIGSGSRSANSTPARPIPPATASSSASALSSSRRGRTPTAPENGSEPPPDRDSSHSPTRPRTDDEISDQEGEDA